jgi:hypothetical protein
MMHARRHPSPSVGFAHGDAGHRRTMQTIPRGRRGQQRSGLRVTKGGAPDNFQRQSPQNWPRQRRQTAVPRMEKSPIQAGCPVSSSLPHNNSCDPIIGQIIVKLDLSSKYTFNHEAARFPDYIRRIHSLQALARQIFTTKEAYEAKRHPHLETQPDVSTTRNIAISQGLPCMRGISL